METASKETKPEVNTIEWDYDERNLVIAVRRGGNDPAIASTTANVYDGNRNLLRVIDAQDTDGSPANNDTVTIADAFGSGNVLTQTGDLVTENIYDRYQRLKKSIDAVGGTVNNFYDPVGNVIQIEQRGTTAGPTPTDRTGSANQVLASIHQYFDELSRHYETQRDIFLPTGVVLGSLRAVTHTEGGLLHNSAADTHNATIGVTDGQSSYALSRTKFDRASRVTHQISDGVETTVTAHDGANRAIKTDAEGNIEEPTYEANSNIVQTRRIEKAQPGGIGSPTVPDEIFITEFAFDVMNRQTWIETQGPDGDINAAADNQITRTAYNSRGLATHFRDALDNTRLQTYDGAGRQTKTEEHLRADETGATAIDPTQLGDGIITTQQTWDGNSRRTSLIDDNGNLTTFGFDALDRQVRLTFADGRNCIWTYDRESNVSRYTDENGSISDRSYDALNHMVNDSITRAPGVIGTTLETFQHDGLGRTTRATDNGDPSDLAQSSVVTQAYDSLSRPLEESLQIGSTGTVRYTTGPAWQTESNRIALTYPNGRKVLTTYDALNRMQTIKDDGAVTPIATWRYIGRSRLLEMAYQNGTCLTHFNDARSRSAHQPGYPSEIRGYNGVGRIIAHRWVPCSLDANGFVTSYPSTTPLTGFRHAWNAADNKLSQEQMQDSVNGEAYKYDSAYRLIRFDRGTLNAALTDVVALTPTPGLLQSQTWTLDGPGNWVLNTATVGAVSTTEPRVHNNLNQITLLGTTPVSYDSNGKLTDDGSYRLEWDVMNRLRRVTRKSDNVVVGRYSYDALGRLIRRMYIAPGTPSPPAVTVHYYL